MLYGRVAMPDFLDSLDREDKGRRGTLLRDVMLTIWGECGTQQIFSA
jgi:hypothetical protein